MILKLTAIIWHAIKLVPEWFKNDWHETYLDSNLNHGQGPRKEDKE